LGAVTTTSEDSKPPETVICWILGLDDAVPTQAEITPVAGSAEIYCAFTTDGKKKIIIPMIYKILFIGLAVHLYLKKS
jgi:hypothetical protein